MNCEEIYSMKIFYNDKLMANIIHTQNIYLMQMHSMISKTLNLFQNNQNLIKKKTQYCSKLK